MPDFKLPWEADDPDDSILSAAALDPIRKGTSSTPDVEAAEHLLDTLPALMVSVSTGGPPIITVEADYKRQYAALAAVLKRLRIPHPNGFRDLWSWYGKWSDGKLPTYASRRAYIAELYDPVRMALEARASAHHELASAADEGPTGWSDVDDKTGKLRRRVREAEDPDDFNAIGLLCVSLLAALGRAAFDSDRHLPKGAEEPHHDDAKTRLTYFLDSAAPGKRFEHVRRMVRAAWDGAQAIKHRTEPNRTDAGVMADSAVLLVSIIRRLADEEEAERPRTPRLDSFARNVSRVDDDIPF